MDSKPEMESTEIPAEGSPTETQTGNSPDTSADSDLNGNPEKETLYHEICSPVTVSSDSSSMLDSAIVGSEPFDIDDYMEISFHEGNEEIDLSTFENGVISNLQESNNKPT